jgi:menaquinone-9 beta-reductase
VASYTPVLHADVVIVGGGPAGLVTALSLLRTAPELADRVVVLEKGRYPREKYCAGALGGRGDAILADLDARPDVPGVDVRGMSFVCGAGEREEKLDAPIGRVVRRVEFDAALAAIAERRGVRILDGAKVTSIDDESGGATVHAADGRSWRARVVVGADGVGSAVRKAVGLGPGLLRAQVLEVDTEPTELDGERDVLRFCAFDRTLAGYTWDFPTVVDGRALVCRGIYHLKRGDERVDLENKLGAQLSKHGQDIRQVKNKRFAERGFEPAATLARGRMLLVGEAAGIDPITGEGIAQAIEYGAMCGEHVGRALRRQAVLTDWSRQVRLSRLGIDLAVRTRLAAYFFGPLRPRVESLVLESPVALRAGCRHFGGLAPRAGEIARIVAEAAMRARPAH